MTILKGQVPLTTHSYTKHSQNNYILVEKERQQKKLSVPVLNNGKPKLALSCLIIYILFHPLTATTTKLY